MPEREAPDARSTQQQARLTELRAEIESAGSDTGRLVEVVMAIAREELVDLEAERELLHRIHARRGDLDVTDIYLEASPWFEPMSEEEELAEGETLVLFIGGGWVANRDRRFS